MIHFKDSDLASESNMIVVSKSSRSLTWWMLLFNNLEFWENISLEMRWLSNRMVITAPDSSFVGSHKYPCFKLWSVVQMGTASFKSMVVTAVVTAWFIYRKIQGTDTQDLQDFKHAARMPCRKLYTSWKQAGCPFVIVCWSQTPDVRVDGAVRIIMK